jgi:HAD superfamily hydrolase (TIGR01549 family)
LAERSADAGLLLDLDDTLVITSRIETLRARRHWALVYEALEQTTLPPGTREFITAITRFPAGVVTSAPRTYAARLLRHHGLDIPVLIAYHDVAYRKPSPEPLLAAAGRLGVPPSRCLHVGDQETDDVAANAAGMHSMLVCWSHSKRGYAQSWDAVLARIHRLVQDGQA